MANTAYHGDKTLKTKLLRELSAHARADSIAQRTYGMLYGDKWRGCAVACSLRSLHKINHTTNKNQVEYSDHAELARLMGVPEVLLHLEDRLFEGVSAAAAKGWPRRFAAAIRPGADLSMVWPRFAIAILSDPERGAAKYADERGGVAIAAVVALLERRVAGDEPTGNEWAAAEAAAEEAEAAARASAWAAASAAAEAAWAAWEEAEEAEAAARAAAWAAWAAEAAAAGSATGSATWAAEAHCEWMADTLIAILEKA